MVAVTSRTEEREVNPCAGCEAMAMDLSAYFDNELDAAQAAQVKQHLAHCAVCRNKLAGMQRMRDGFSQLADHRVAPRRSILYSLLKLLTRNN